MPDVQMDFDLMEDMAQLFRAGAGQLEETMATLRQIADEFENGVLQGQGGNALAEYLRNNFVGRVGMLRDKFEELGQDVYGALVDLRDGDSEAASRFKG